MFRTETRRPKGLFALKTLFGTKMLKTYMLKFGARLLVFFSVLWVYLRYKEEVSALLVQPLWKRVTPLHVLWVFFMCLMLSHLFPRRAFTMALRKVRARDYIPVPGYSEQELYHFVKDQNVKAWKVMLLWLLFNSLWGFLYLVGWIDNADLLMLTVFYFLCDYVCILFYCPFQNGIMGSRCCVNCRIYDWGHFMMFTPMLFIRNFFSWSLFAVSCVVLIRWEITYAKYPERFWSGSNQALQCACCKDKTCQIKRRIESLPVSRRLQSIIFRKNPNMTHAAQPAGEEHRL